MSASITCPKCGTYIVTDRRLSKVMTPEMINKIRERRRQGETLKEIAADLGRSYVTVWKYTCDIPTKATQQAQQAFDLLDRGYRPKDIAKEMGLARSRVSWFLHKSKLAKKRKGK